MRRVLVEAKEDGRVVIEEVAFDAVESETEVVVNVGKVFSSVGGAGDGRKKLEVGCCVEPMFAIPGDGLPDGCLLAEPVCVVLAIEPLFMAAVCCCCCCLPPILPVLPVLPVLLELLVLLSLLPPNALPGRRGTAEAAFAFLICADTVLSCISM